MEAISNMANKARQAPVVRWGLGAGASMLLSASVLGIGVPMPTFLHASTSDGRVALTPLHQEIVPVEVIDMSTSTVAQIVAELQKAERFELMLYNSGAGEVLLERGDYTVFIPASAYFDYLPKGYVAELSRRETAQLAKTHIVARSLPLEEALSGNVVTMGNTAVSFEVTAEGQATVGEAKVLKAYKASNGWVYLINQVLVD